MECYSLEQLHLCRLATVERRDILLLTEDGLRTYLIVSELKDRESQVLNNRPDYHSLSGQECFSGTQRIMFTAKDIGKIFVMDVKEVPEEFFTEEEKEKGVISRDRLSDLARKVKYLQW